MKTLSEIIFLLFTLFLSSCTWNDLDKQEISNAYSQLVNSTTTQDKSQWYQKLVMFHSKNYKQASFYLGLYEQERNEKTVARYFYDYCIDELVACRYNLALIDPKKSDQLLKLNNEQGGDVLSSLLLAEKYFSVSKFFEAKKLYEFVLMYEKSPLAEYRLGLIHSQGLTGDVDIVLARSYLISAAKNGMAQAAFALSCTYPLSEYDQLLWLMIANLIDSSAKYRESINIKIKKTRFINDDVKMIEYKAQQFRAIHNGPAFIIQFKPVLLP